MDNHFTGTPLYFTVPDHLQEIRLDEDPERRIKRTYEHLRMNLRGATEEQCLYIIYHQETMVAELLGQGAVYLALCLARSESDPATLSTAQFTILVKDADLQAERPLAAVAGGLKTAGQPREIIFSQFPAGEALIVGEELTVRRPVTVTGQPVAHTHRVRQAQIILPFPDKQRLAIVGVTSESLGDWPYYVETLNAITHSISFTRPSKAGIASRLAGLG
jgi:hypothetical protein